MGGHRPVGFARGHTHRESKGDVESSRFSSAVPLAFPNSSMWGFAPAAASASASATPPPTQRTQERIAEMVSACAPMFAECLECAIEEATQEHRDTLEAEAADRIEARIQERLDGLVEAAVAPLQSAVETMQLQVRDIDQWKKTQSEALVKLQKQVEQAAATRSESVVKSEREVKGRLKQLETRERQAAEAWTQANASISEMETELARFASLASDLQQRVGNAEQGVRKLAATTNAKRELPAETEKQPLMTLSKQVQAIQSTFSKLQAKSTKSEKEESERALSESNRMSVLDATVQSEREKMAEVQATTASLRQLVLKQMRAEQTAETMLKEYAGKISTEVAGVMNKVISLRICDNNKLLDATLTARLPEYAKNTDRRFVLVRPDDSNNAVVVPAEPNDSQDDLLQKASMLAGSESPISTAFAAAVEESGKSRPGAVLTSYDNAFPAPVSAPAR